ncbi:MAG TPA: addiction module protein [Gemmatales bacterium]|nr:addiction module protein [Gemmatales bacterium]
MSAVNEQLLEATLALPEEDRLEFLEAISQSLQAPGCPPIDESWRSVIKQRSEEIRSGKVQTVPWSTVKEQAREQAIA